MFKVTFVRNVEMWMCQRCKRPTFKQLHSQLKHQRLQIDVVASVKLAV